MASSGFLGGFRKARAVAEPVARDDVVDPPAIPARLFVPAGELLPFDLRNAGTDRTAKDAAASLPAIDIAIAPSRVTGTPLIHCIGDSLTNRLMPALDAALRGCGLAPAYAGTVEQAGGFMGEARDGKLAGQYVGAFPGMGPVPPGGEAAYLALPNTDRLNRNPYATLDGTGEPSIDVAGYFERFDLDVPDYVVIALGTNDTKVRPASALAHVERLLDSFVPQLLALDPNLRIGLLQHTIHRIDDATEDRWRIQHAIIRACIARAAAEPRVEVIPSYLHQSATKGWPEPIGDDGEPRVEIVHFGEANARIAAAVTAAWIAWHEARDSDGEDEPADVIAPPSNQPTLRRAAGGDNVRALFRLVLGREPESQAIIDQNAGLSTAALLESLLASDEYRRRQPGDVAERIRGAFPSGEIAVGATAEQLDALVERTRDTWAKLGVDNPYWSVLTNEAFRGGTIGGTLERTFFDSGRGEVAAFIAACERNGVVLPTNGAVIDLGCGVGRIGIHLAQRFDSYIGVDISEPHLRLAGQHFMQANIESATFLTLDEFVEAPRSFDCFFSLITLQHSPPPIMCALLDLLMGSLNRGGIGYFQVPHALYDYSYSAAEHLAQPNALGEMEIHAMPQRDVFKVIRGADCDLIEALPDGKIGASGLSTTYLIRKR